jgi:hypothetical protein
MNIFKRLNDYRKKNIQFHESVLLATASLIRKRWLQSFYIYFTIFTLMFLGNLYLELSEPTMPLILLLGASLFDIVFTFIAPYYFGYKKGGTKSLLFAFVLKIKTFIDLSNAIYAMAQVHIDISIVLPLIMLICLAYYTYCTIQLYSLNNALKKTTE